MAAKRTAARLRASAFLLAAALADPVGPAEASSDPLDPLYQRIARDLKAGRPLVITVHVALCDNRIIRCGGRGLGDGLRPGRNLYWGGASGFLAHFRYVRGYRRVFLDGGDGKVILERAVYRMRVEKPSAFWQRRGVTKPFDVLLLGLAYRGDQIGRANHDFIGQVATGTGSALKLPDGRTVAVGGHGHVVGYAGHNHLMDVKAYRWPAVTRKDHVGYFALSCRSAPYLAPHLTHRSTHALLLTRILMYPGAFTIDGLARGLAQGLPQRAVFMRGVKRYARRQKRPVRLIQRSFTHDARPRFRFKYRLAIAHGPGKVRGPR